MNREFPTPWCLVGFVIVFGLLGCSRELPPVPQAESSQDFTGSPSRVSNPVGAIPGVAVDENAAVGLVAEALKTGKYPERINPLFKPRPFDLESFQRDPLPYLEMVEPGRVWQSAQPAEGVPVVSAESSMYLQVVQGESARLSVRVPSGAPVTFTNFDSGEFENRLGSITKQASAEGIATATLTAISGVVGDVRILASSPLASGQVEFLVKVSLPPSSSLSSSE